MMPKEPSKNDPAIDDAIRRVRKGEADAFEAVVRRFETPLRAWLAVHAAPGVDVDEVAQRSLVDAFRRLDEYRLGTNFAAWLFTIGRFQLRTEMTRLRRVADYHARYAFDLLQRELERRSAELPEVHENRLAYLEECLGKLGAHLRRFITWRYEEEIPLEEMALRSGRSVPAVKKQLWKLRRVLHECIEIQTASEGAQS